MSQISSLFPSTWTVEWIDENKFGESIFKLKEFETEEEAMDFALYLKSEHCENITVLEDGEVIEEFNV